MPEKDAQAPTLSIVTITLNDPDGLEATLRSVWENVPEDAAVEQIVVDGISSYDVPSVLEAYDSRVRLIRERDRGIYDAMNKGLRAAQGAYVLFLNSGDKLTPDAGWQDIIALLDAGEFDFVYGDSLERQLDGTVVHKKARSHRRVALGMFTHHQAMIFRRSICAQNLFEYDLNFPIASDYDFVVRFLRASKKNRYEPVTISEFQAGGLSQRNVEKGRREQFTIRARQYNSSLMASTVYILQAFNYRIRLKLPGLYWFLKK